MKLNIPADSLKAGFYENRFSQREQDAIKDARVLTEGVVPVRLVDGFNCAIIHSIDSAPENRQRLAFRALPLRLFTVWDCRKSRVNMLVWQVGTNQFSSDGGAPRPSRFTLHGPGTDNGDHSPEEEIYTLLRHEWRSEVPVRRMLQWVEQNYGARKAVAA